MSKTHPGGVPFPVITTNATTAGREMTRAISDSADLQDKTHYCVFLEKDGDVTMLVYRDSSTAPGLLSARWRNRRRRGAMASALFTYSEDLENDADSEPAGLEEDS